MAQYAWVLEVRPGYEEEYVRRHQEIWPEMVEALRSAGISNYSIFRHGLTLFGYFETDDIEETRGYLANSETNQRWSEWVTTLTAKAVSFSGHARAAAPRYVLVAPSEREYVACGVDVPIGNVPTRAIMYPIRERLSYLPRSATRATRLCGVPGVDRHDSRTSLFRFVREYLQKLRPTRVVRGLREPAPGKTFWMDPIMIVDIDPTTDFPYLLPLQWHMD
jgi:L-rhamnose mutarotase